MCVYLLICIYNIYNIYNLHISHIIYIIHIYTYIHILHQHEIIENSYNLSFIGTSNPNNSKIFDLVKSGENTQKTSI